MVGAGDHCHGRLGRKKSMQYVLLLLDAEDATEQCVVIVLDELS